jgi:hypothetical protein
MWSTRFQPTTSKIQGKDQGGSICEYAVQADGLLRIMSGHDPVAW